MPDSTPQSTPESRPTSTPKPTSKPLAQLGAHVSVAGGVANAFANGEAIDCDALQIFVKSPNRWQANPFTEKQLADYQRAQAEHQALPIFAHAAYLINLSATSPEILDKSRAGLLDELSRAQQLGLQGLVVHPGAHLGEGTTKGTAAVSRSLDVILQAAHDAGNSVPILLENTAGQGTTLGASIGELAEMIAGCDQPQQVGICLDTCHAFAAGYDLRTAAGLEKLLAETEDSAGLDKVRCWHLNDSVFPLGKRRDRHANIGTGEIGLAAFVQLCQDERLAGLPMILETPLGDDGLGHKRDLERLRAALGS